MYRALNPSVTLCVLRDSVLKNNRREGFATELLGTQRAHLVEQYLIAPVLCI
jgi:hypothetical protein